MRIGLTYDLRADYLAAATREEETAEFDRAETVEAIEAAIRRLGHATDRIGNVRRLVGGAGPRATAGTWCSTSPRGCTASAARPRCRRSSTSTTSPTRSPIRWSWPGPAQGPDQARACATAGMPTPTFAVVAQPGGRRRRRPAAARCSPSRWPRGRARASTAGSVVRTTAGAARASATSLLATLPAAGAGRDVSCPAASSPSASSGTGAGGRGRSARWRSSCGAEAEPGSTPTSNKEQCEELVEYRLVRRRARPAGPRRPRRSRWRPGGCWAAATRAGSTCAATPTAEPQFIEVNPLAGLHPEHSDLPILCNAGRALLTTELIGASCDSAGRAPRAGPTPHRRLPAMRVAILHNARRRRRRRLTSRTSWSRSRPWREAALERLGHRPSSRCGCDARPRSRSRTAERPSAPTWCSTWSSRWTGTAA